MPRHNKNARDWPRGTSDEAIAQIRKHLDKDVTRRRRRQATPESQSVEAHRPSDYDKFQQLDDEALHALSEKHGYQARVARVVLRQREVVEVMPTDTEAAVAIPDTVGSTLVTQLADLKLSPDQQVA